MKAKRSTAAMNGIGANSPSSSLKHGIDRDREREKRRRVADGNVGKEFQTASQQWRKTQWCGLLTPSFTDQLQLFGRVSATKICTST